MWVEPDCVMPAGESLVRQLLYGQRAFRARFGAEHTVCWLPDCFGFTPALPQLLRGAGIEQLLHDQALWSETNRFPHDLFWWEGLDGSRVLAHLFDNPDGGYNGVVGPVSALATWRNYRGRDIHPESLLSVGYGDGGGGPDARDDRARPRAGRLPRRARAALRPRATSSSPGRSAAWPSAALPTWVGELYLELHRGTLTSQGRTKRAHRRAERDLVAAEVLGALTRARRRRDARRRSSRSGGCCCATSSTTSCPGRASARWPRRPRPSSAGSIAAAGEVIDARLAELAERIVGGRRAARRCSSSTPTSRRARCAR